MPIVQIHLLEGRSLEQKRTMAEKVTRAVVDSVGCAPEAVKIIMSDMKKHDYAEAGILYQDKQKA